MTVLVHHRVPGPVFDAVASGFGDEAAIEVLVQGQLSRRKTLLAALAEQLGEDPAAGAARTRFTQAYAVLAELEAEAPQAITGRDGVLRHPFFEVWGIDCLRSLLRVRRGEAPRAAVEARLEYLTAAAGVAALRAGVALELEVVVSRGGLPLPGLGRTAQPDGDGNAVLRTDGSTLAVVTRDGRALATHLARPLTAAPHPVRLEDTDPYRDTFGRPVVDREDDARAAAWRDTFTRAWQLVHDDHPAYLPGLSGGLLAVTPLVTPDSGADASAAARRAFGAVAAVLPPTPARLAVLLIHEFNHVKLGALEDLVTLFDDSDGSLHYAPWRPDPRPLPNLVQGTYAHLGVTDFWRVHRHHAGADTALANRQFARWRTQTARAIEVVAASAALTAEGRRFAGAMAATMAPWLEEPVPAADVRAAEQAARRHQEDWEAARRTAPERS